jgi:hypothetical protein
MFRALLIHPQAALHKQHLVYCLHVFSVCCTILAQPTDITRTQNMITKCRLFAPPEEEQLMLKTCGDP